MPRKRAHVSLKTKLAAALTCLLPQEQRDEMRYDKRSADDILRLFEWDHVVLWALNGSNHWSNLDPKLKDSHREKSRKDTAIVAKVKRIQRKHGIDTVNRIEVVLPPGWLKRDIAPAAKSIRKRRIPSRPFPKVKRPLRWKGPRP